MRVRPIFWCVLALACVSVLIFAATVHLPLPTVMQMHVMQTVPTSGGFETRIELHLSDTQGIPIDRAQIIPDAYMTNMDMRAEHMQVVPRGDGHYDVRISLSMAGPWAIRIMASANGFDAQQQHLLLQVT